MAGLSGSAGDTGVGAVCVGVLVLGEDCGVTRSRSFFCDWGAGGSGVRTFWLSGDPEGAVAGTSCDRSSGKYSGPLRPQPARLNNSTGTRSVRADEIIGAV